jgi:hypothetical protein
LIKIKTKSHQPSKHKGKAMNSNADLNMIAELDLDPIKVKLMHKESGEGWSLEQANAVEFEYRRFLCLMKLFPHEQTAPLFDVDIFWHYHILDTMKYAADCEQIFGYFLHHFPYVGLRGDGDDEAVHHRVGARMQQLYEATFGEGYIRQEAVRAATAITANSQGVAVQTAYSQGIAAKTAYSQGIAQNDQFYSVRPVLGTAKMAYSQGVAQNDNFYSARPVLGTAKTAYSQGVAQNDSFYSGRPVLGTAKTAYSQGVAQNDSFYSARPVLGTAKTAYSQGVAQNDSFYSARPGLGTAKTAYSQGVAQNDSFYSARPGLVNAA